MQDFDALIQKFWEGKASPEEKARLLERLGGGQLHQPDFRAQFERDLEAPPQVLPQQRSEELLQAILQKRRKAAPVRRLWWAAAAAAAVLAAVLFLPKTRQPQPTPIAKILHTPQLITNTQNTDLTATLEDGSTLVLSPHASVSYVLPFDTARALQMTGKIYFNVAKDPQRPFSVTAGGVTTRVLGTEFVVNTVPSVTVRLLSGKIAVAGRILAIGQTASINNGILTIATEKKQSPPEALVFDKTPLSTVFARIGRRYHTPIAFDRQDVRGLQFTGSFHDRDSLGMLLSVICNMNGLTFTREGHAITIHSTQ